MPSHDLVGNCLGNLIPVNRWTQKHVHWQCPLPGRLKASGLLLLLAKFNHLGLTTSQCVFRDLEGSKEYIQIQMPEMATWQNCFVTYKQLTSLIIQIYSRKGMEQELENPALFTLFNARFPGWLHLETKLKNHKITDPTNQVTNPRGLAPQQ